MFYKENNCMIIFDSNKFCPKRKSVVEYIFKSHLFHKKNKFQTIDIYEHEQFGNVLVIDGDIQIAEKDSYIYDKALVDPIMPAKKIAVMGGGDCGVLRELLTRKDVEEVVLIDIDQDVIDASKQFLKKIMDRSLEDKRAKLVIDNAFKFIEGKKFDAIIYDLTMDPVGAPQDFFGAIAQSLNDGGKLTMQVSCIHNKKIIEKAHSELEKHFKNIKLTEVNIPSYLEPWIFAYAEK